MIKQKEVLTLPDGEYTAAPGLVLVVKRNGRNRSWLLAMTMNKKRYRRGLGSARDLTLAQAKIAAETLRVKLRSGETEPKKVLPKTDSANVRPLFKDHYAAAIENYATKAQWKNMERDKAAWYARMKNYVLGSMGDKVIADITYQDVLDVIEPIWLKRHPTAEDVRSNLETIFDRFIQKGLYPRGRGNPAQWYGNLEFELTAHKKAHKVQHYVAATFEELRDAVPKLLTEPNISCYAMVFGILTACRENEFLCIQKGEIDLKKALWTMPAERRKDGKSEDFVVPLSRQAVALIKDYQVFLKDWLEKKRATAKRWHEKFVEPPETSLFPGSTQGAAFPANTTVAKYLRRACGNNEVDIHGCRSTFSSWCAEQKKNRETVEKALMHATGTATSRIYNRSELLNLRRQLMQEWADAVMAKSGY